jgi:phosphate-selective porin
MRLLPFATLLVPGLLTAQQAAQSNPSTPVKMGGYLQSRLVYQKDVGLTTTINRARLTATGTISPGFSYRIQGEFRTGNVGTGRASVSLTDAYIRWAHQAFGVQVGQFKTPFTREYLTGIADLETLDRSTAVDSLAPKRDIGLLADYQFGKHLLVTAGAFNGEGQNVTANRDSTLLGVARAAVKPIPQLSIGANVARYFGGKDDWGWLALAGVRVVPAVQLVGKYEDFRREQISAEQRNRAVSAGVNWYAVTSVARLSAFYVSRKIGDPGVRKGALQTQLQVRF